jgi:glycosyltransferase involved in cell wall biosynthesis
MKILLVHNEYQQRGGEDVVFDQEFQLLKRGGHDVIAYRRSNWEVESYSGARRLVLACRTTWAKDTQREFAELVRGQKPDLVHIHNTFVMISPSIYSVCRDAGIPVVQTLHNYRLFCPGGTFFREGRICEECLQHGLSRSVLHGCYRNSRTATAVAATMLVINRRLQTWTSGVTCYIALTEFSRSKFVQAGLPADKVLVKPNFVHPDPYSGADRGARDYVLFVGRLSPEKRVSTLIEACTLLRNRIPLVIIGGGPERQQLAEHISRHGLHNVHLQGQLQREEVIAAMNRARLLLFPSEWYENFPVTIAESFGCGVPVICSQLGAMKEIVEHGRTGLHFIPGDAVDLAEKLDWAWEHDAQVRVMGKEARQEYQDKYTAAKNYPILLDIYQHAMQLAA